MNYKDQTLELVRPMDNGVEVYLRAIVSSVVQCFCSSAQAAAPKQLMNKTCRAIEYIPKPYIYFHLYVHMYLLVLLMWSSNFITVCTPCVCYNTAACSPPCENGGTCSAPDTCTCDIGFTGTECGTGRCSVSR